MSVYLHDIPLEEARRRFEEALQQAGLDGVLGTETIPLDDRAVGRVLAEPVWARISSPHYHAAAMDGFALRSADTTGAMPATPVTLRYGEHVQYVDTGDPIPLWADAVVPIELVEPLNAAGEIETERPRAPHAIRLRQAARPWQNIRPIGEDIVATSLVLPAGHTLRPVDLGAIAACGHSEIVVARKPRVAVLPTGTELVPIGTDPRPGDILEYNSVVLSAQVRQWGGEPTRFPISKDDFDLIRSRVAEATRGHDLVLVNAGSSAGMEDFTAGVVESLGELLVHGIAVRPGHPVIMGVLHVEGRHVPVIGVPGYPAAAALTGEIFVEPLLSRWLGRAPHRPPIITARLTRKLASPAGDDDYIRVAVGKVGDRWLAAPLARGAGVITSLVRADGILVVPRGRQGYDAGTEVPIRLYRPPQELGNTIFAVGSHDVILDLLAQFLAARDRRLASAHVGSLGGLVALRRGEAHFAGSHLLDPETGEYNLAYIRRYLPGVPVVVLGMVEREQGLMVLPGNPKGIRGLEDLTRPDVTFVNRQRGAGTRVLLDYHLERLGIQPEQVKGYEQEEFTHLAVAAAVSAGRADCGLGIPAAAQALGLDFVPLFHEEYDLIIPREHYESPLLAPLYDVLADDGFRQMVMRLPGYNVENMGRILAELE